MVRLKEGDPDRQTVFSDEPLATARQWIEQGATWLHMINLDGAFASVNNNGLILEAVASLGINVQFGGGLRQIPDIEQAVERGATRVVLGTVAVQNPQVVAEAVQRWGSERVCVALDARDGKVTTHGWRQGANLTPVELGLQMVDYGVRHVLYTDVSRDGGLQGVNITATVSLARETGLQVIASGGVSSMTDIESLSMGGEVTGVVIGMALYEGRIRLNEAIALAEGKRAG